MAIKDKSGNVYKLRGPNPMMESQDLWDMQQVVFLNKDADFDVIIVPDTTKSVRKILKDYIQKEPKEQQLELITEKPNQKLHVDEKMNQLLEEKKIPILCQMAILKESIDPLYGVKYSSVTYGPTFTFRGIIASESDLEIQLWSDQKIQPQSIVFPQNGNKRCWKIDNLMEKSGGYLMHATISDISPRF